MKDEESCIDKAKGGDERAFRELYESHVDSLYRFMRQYSKDSHQVEEWVQRAFIKAYKNIGGFNATARFSTWLYTIALNEMRSDYRRPSIVVLDAAGSQILDQHQREDDAFMWDDIMKMWLDDLEESKKTVFLLYEVEGYSHAEIASMLNIGESSSRTLLHRAKHYLRTRWKEEEKSA